MYVIPEAAFDELSGRDGSVGVIILKRQQALNALNLVMLSAISQRLTEWENAAHIKAVVIRAAEGRAFCAGGDIRAVYERRMMEDPALFEFFRDEYRLNYKVRCFRKPYIALLDGITMGGGAGLSVHGSHRVATDRLLFAMPETGIGFYPDVGMSYVLSRLPHQMGFYLGLTGARLSRGDCEALGLVTHSVSEEAFPELMYTLADTSLNSDARGTVSALLERFSEVSGGSELWEHREEISTCFAGKTVEEILKALKAGSTWCKEVAEVICQKSPTSLKITYQALKNAADLDFDACMEMEYALTRHVLQGSDFFEGIRAVVIDRDQKPQWKPRTLREVTARMVAGYFAPMSPFLHEDH